MNRARLLTRTAALFLGVSIASVILWRGARGPEQAALERGDFGAVKDFHLTERSGRMVSLADLKGKVWVADFVFTRCMGPCPVLSKAMSRLQEFFASRPDVRFVSFSVDPNHDVPAVLADYAARFGADPARWLFLTGEAAAVREAVMGSFKMALQDNAGAPPGEAVTHSLHFVVVDREGRIRGYFAATEPRALDRLKERVKELS